jgi:hypothetical protein
MMTVMGDKATVNVCYTVQADSYEVASGRTIDSAPFSREVGAGLTWQDNHWALSDRVTWDDRTWEGSTECVGI